MAFWSVAIAACSFTDLDDLMKGTLLETDEADSGDVPVDSNDAADPDVPLPDGGKSDGSEPSLDDGGVEPTLDADAAEEVAFYAPPEGEYAYVQNTAAYNAGEFDASANKLGIDYAKLAACGTTFNSTRPQVDPMPATVVRDPDSAEGTCWTLHIDLRPTDGNGGHQEDESFCARDGALYARGQKSTVQVQKWVFGAPIGAQTATATTICDSSTLYLWPKMGVGETQLHACEGTTTATSGKYVSMGGYEYVGPDKVTIDGIAEDVFHVRRDRAVSGIMEGREVTEFYMSVKDAMPLRIHRWTHIVTPIEILCIESVDYNNYGSDWLLKTRSPKSAGGSTPPK